MAVRGLKPSEFFALPFLDQILYYEAVRLELEAEKSKIMALGQMLGLKKAT